MFLANFPCLRPFAYFMNLCILTFTSHKMQYTYFYSRTYSVKKYLRFNIIVSAEEHMYDLFRVFELPFLTKKIESYIESVTALELHKLPKINVRPLNQSRINFAPKNGRRIHQSKLCSWIFIINVSV